MMGSWEVCLPLLLFKTFHMFADGHRLSQDCRKDVVVKIPGDPTMLWMLAECSCGNTNRDKNSETRRRPLTAARYRCAQCRQHDASLMLGTLCRTGVLRMLRPRNV